MTRRERLEAKRDKREQWAEGRAAKAAELHQRNEPFRGDNAFNTQPGHIPERARAIARTERAWEHSKMADHHTQKAEGLNRQLVGSIFSDDADAVEALEARIASLEEERDRVKRFNATARKGSPDTSILDEVQRNELASLLKIGSVFVGKGGSFPAYHLSNLSGNIKRNRDRLAQVKARHQRSAEAEANGGVVVELLAYDYACVTFAEKPAREVLTELKSAGFTWGSGSWTGKADRLPDSLREDNGQ